MMVSNKWKIKRFSFSKSYKRKSTGLICFSPFCIVLLDSIKLFFIRFKKKYEGMNDVKQNPHIYALLCYGCH